MGNPDTNGGFYIATYEVNRETVDRQKGLFRHYINFVDQGSITYHTPQGDYQFQTGDFYYMPKGIRSTTEYRNTKIISFGFSYFPDADNHPFLPQKLPHRFLDRFLALPRKIAPTVQTVGVFYMLLADMLPYMEQAENQYSQSLLRELRIFIWRNFQCQVADMARYCGTSVPSLYRHLQQLTGKTPNQIKQEILFEKAMVLLSNTHTSIQNISDSLGFCNVNYFTKVFKKHTGKTPRQYRLETANFKEKAPLE